MVKIIEIMSTQFWNKIPSLRCLWRLNRILYATANFAFYQHKFTSQNIHLTVKWLILRLFTDSRFWQMSRSNLCESGCGNKEMSENDNLLNFNFNFHFLAVTRQLNRWPCHSVTDSVSDSVSHFWLPPFEDWDFYVLVGLNFWPQWQFLMTIVDGNFLWQFLMTI